MTNAQLLTELVRALQGNKAKAKPAKKAQKSVKPTKDEFLTGLVKAAEKRGYANPQPNVNILTYDRWLEKGRRVRKGEKSIVVAGRKSALFHESQTQEEPKAA